MEIARRLRQSALAIVLALPGVAFGQDLVLRVGITTGDVFIENTTGSAVTFDAYEINSASGALLPENWLSVADNYDLSGDQSVDALSNWFELSDSATTIAEGSLLPLTGSLDPGERVDLGPIWQFNGAADLMLEYQEGLEIFSAETFFFLEADANQDDLVTAADFTILRDLTGATGSSVDVVSDGVIDAADVLSFQQQFGAVNPFASPALAPSPAPSFVGAVPEPLSVAALSLQAAALTAVGRPRRLG